MFQTAYKIASGFTFPVVLSRLARSGACSASIGSYVVINKDGWFVTAYHIAAHLVELADGEKRETERDAKVQKIKNDASLSAKDKSRALNALGKVAQTDTIRASAWWGKDGLRIDGNIFHCNPLADIAIGRFANFDPSTVGTYPKIKDPAQDMEPGASLCKLGFPFHQIVPTWDDARSAFVFDPHIPRFPIDGIMTRVTIIADVAKPMVNAKMIETSSPGLRGQSGGPIFDTQGTIWAIQSQTAHYPLGFASGTKRPEQYLNVGVGAHVEEVIKLFRAHGVAYEQSAY